MKTIPEITQYYGPQLAKAAFELGAIRLNTKNPFTWASGYRMPIYNDNRQFLARASHRALICDAFADMTEALRFDICNIAGTATAGIPHATTLADRLQKPLSYVRSASKDHGLGHQIEGLGQSGSYEGQNVLLIEDLISTGSSSIKAVDAIVNADGKCPYCLAIFTYGLDKGVEAFAALNPECTPYSILSYPVMLETALSVGYIGKEEWKALNEWRESPFTWGEDRGFKKVER
jgi:Orotate phosphoribosyltransferase